MDTTSSSAAAGKAAVFGAASLLARSHVARQPKSLAEPLRDLLLHSALLAVACGMDDEAVAIKEVLVGLGVDPQRLDMAIAIVKLRRGDVQGCLALLEGKVLAREPEHELALAVQASAWQSQGLPQGRIQANALLATSANPLVRSIARSPISN
jgi:hypothetical protein